MPYSATVFHVLIASPSDVPDERIAIAEVLHSWNSLNSKEMRMVMLPIRWETHSAPGMGDRPQAIINDQVVKDCDMIVGAFWTRLGSPTGKEDSGTVEEIKWFLDQKKPVMLYFSAAPIPQETMDLDQIKKLKEFRASIRDRGIQGTYTSIADLRENLLRQLTVVARGMSTSPMIDKKVVRAAQESTKLATEEKSAQESKLAPTAPTPDGLYFEDYSEKAFIVRGDTTAFREALKNAGGRWIPTKTGGKGWMFSKRHIKDIAKILKIPAALG